MERALNPKRGERDVISSLPDCLIHLIMSFLTAQQAVRTCVLSKRWKNLWTTLPFLKFDLCYFRYDSESDDSESEDGGPRRKRIGKFRDFVTMTLLHREASDLHKFHLSCQEMCDWYEYRMFVRSWIFYVLKHNPQVLNVDFMIEDSLPLSVFTCASLVDVSLDCFTPVHGIEVINLPCLRRLHLTRIDLTQDFVDKLFTGCPVLEFLHLKACNKAFSTINSQSLKYLNVRCCCSCRWTETRMELINTPNLLSFYDHICLDSIEPKMLLKMPSLTSARICIERCGYKWSYKGKSNILIGLSNVQTLKITGAGDGIKDLLENELQNCPEFSKLKDLDVECLCLSCHFSLLASFLNHCPNLEKLSIFHHGSSCWAEVHGIQESFEIAPFKGSRLKTVKVLFSKSDKSCPQVVKYLQDLTEKSGTRINMTVV